MFLKTFFPFIFCLLLSKAFGAPRLTTRVEEATVSAPDSLVDPLVVITEEAETLNSIPVIEELDSELSTISDYVTSPPSIPDHDAFLTSFLNSFEVHLEKQANGNQAPENVEIVPVNNPTDEIQGRSDFGLFGLLISFTSQLLTFILRKKLIIAAIIAGIIAAFFGFGGTTTLSGDITTEGLTQAFNEPLMVLDGSNSVFGKLGLTREEKAVEPEEESGGYFAFLNEFLVVLQGQMKNLGEALSFSQVTTESPETTPKSTTIGFYDSSSTETTTSTKYPTTTTYPSTKSTLSYSTDSTYFTTTSVTVSYVTTTIYPSTKSTRMYSSESTYFTTTSLPVYSIYTKSSIRTSSPTTYQFRTSAPTPSYRSKISSPSSFATMVSYSTTLSTRIGYTPSTLFTSTLGPEESYNVIFSDGLYTDPPNIGDNKVDRERVVVAQDRNTFFDQYVEEDPEEDVLINYEM